MGVILYNRIVGRALQSIAVLGRLLRGVPENPPAQLDQAERQLLELIASGRTDKEIADMMALSEEEVKTRIRTTTSKLEATRRSQAIAYVSEWRMRHFKFTWTETSG